MKNKVLIKIALGLIVSFPMISYAQNVGINSTGTAPNTYALLDLNTGNTFTNPNGKGLMIPNVSLSSTTDITIFGSVTPPTSLLVYNSNAAMTGGWAGYWWWNGAKWVAFLNSTGLGAGWLVTGNAGTTAGTNFLGTTDATDMVFKTNGVENMRIANSTGFIGINTGASPGAYLSFENLNNNTTPDGITWYNPAPTAYGIFRTSGSWTGPNYQQLELAWQTGVIIDGGTAYGESGTMLQPNGGNVGVNTVHPLFTLDLNQGSFGFGASNSRTEYNNDAGAYGDVVGSQSGFYQTAAPSPSADWPTSTASATANFDGSGNATSWWHLIECRHSNGANNYALELAGGFFDQNLYYRKTNNSASTPWSQLLTVAAANTGYIENQFAGAQVANHWVSGSSRAGEVYCADWFRNDNAGTGLYNQTTGAGIYSPSAGLMETYNGSALQIDGASNGSGNLRFTCANPYIVSSSYYVCPGGAYFNSGTVYFQTQSQHRGGIHNDGAAYLEVDGGTSGYTYFPSVSTGIVGIGISNPSWPLHVYSASLPASSSNIWSDNETNQGAAIYGLNGNSSNTYDGAIKGVNTYTGNAYLGGGVIGIFTAGSGTGYGTAGESNSNSAYGVYGSAPGGTYAGYFNGNLAYTSGIYHVSDQKLKTNIQPIQDPLSKLMKLNGVEYDMNLEKYPDYGLNDKHEYGVIAQQIQTVFPSLVMETSLTKKVNASDKPNQSTPAQSTPVLAVNYMGLIPVIIEAVKEQQKEIEATQPLRNEGSAQLSNGRTHVNLDESFAQKVGTGQDIHVFVQLEGDCKGVYVTNITSSGFDVIELSGGTSDVKFFWQANVSPVNSK